MLIEVGLEEDHLLTKIDDDGNLDHVCTRSMIFGMIIQFVSDTLINKERPLSESDL